MFITPPFTLASLAPSLPTSLSLPSITPHSVFQSFALLPLNSSVKQSNFLLLHSITSSISALFSLPLSLVGAENLTELSMSSTAKNAPLSRVLLSCFVLFSSFFLSHPVLFSYFVFLSPYLLKLVTFLSPLLITTFLILLALLTLSPGLEGSPDETSESKVGFVSKVCARVLEKLRSNSADEDGGTELSKDLEVYKIFFEEASLWDSGKSQDEASDQLETPGDCGSEESEAPVDKFLIYGDNVVKGHSEASATKFEQDPVDISEPGFKVEDKLEGLLLQEKVRCESEGAVFKAEEKEVKLPDSSPKKVGEEEDPKEDDPLFKGGSKAGSNTISDPKARDNHGGGCFPRTRQNSRRLGESLRLFDENGGGEQSYYSPDHVSESHYEKTGLQHLGSFGSMRREKEWKRTLACKLFEERHNAEEGSEGMDLLWEAYEDDSSSKQAKNGAKQKKKGKRGGRLEKDEAEAEEEEEEEDVDEQFCCLQALKFSAGKMNLGMGRPNLVRISKAFRGIGWLHHVGRHSKRGHNHN
ncbi:uncharacterized protein LOC115742400 isoform X2 [Rhodamnia argentea]|uniref:Uncharacterized protein LOC115742400 isoform X2 n=1 Tax=Rhodamnia argentea TaxID=178133 RepID=A0A8B8PCI0_9MYRT|nr:uncharacterized protein LOC115742400 isoform X2 [Rhodamnia argentea]